MGVLLKYQDDISRIQGSEAGKILDEIIKIIRGSKDGEEAKLELCNKFWKANGVEKYIELIDDPDNKVVDGTYKLSELQAKAILDLRLQRLTGLESEKITLEINDLSDNINKYLYSNKAIKFIFS